MPRLKADPARLEYETAVKAGAKFKHMILADLLDAMNTCATLDDYTLKGLEIEVTDFRNADEDDVVDAGLDWDSWVNAQDVLTDELSNRFGWWYEETRHIEF